jgi:hypothetical protein
MTKRMVIGICLVLLVAVNAFAASSLTCSVAGGGRVFDLIKCVAVSDSDGTFTASTLLTVGNGIQYWSQDAVLAHAYAINRSSGQPDTAGTVTITDAAGQQIVGATVGDTLTLSTSASGGAYLSADRASSQRPVMMPLYITIGDTQSGAATSTFDLYLLLRK